MEKITKILALDLSTRTGWAVCAVGKKPFILSGIQDFSLERGDSPGMRFLRFRRWLMELIRGEKVNLIAFEQAHNRGGAPTMVLNGMIAITEELCAEYGIEHKAVHSSTIKKFWTGKGNANKNDMILASKEKGYEIKDDNEADAIALLHFILEKIMYGD